MHLSTELPATRVRRYCAFCQICNPASAPSSGSPPLSMLYFSLSVPFCLRLLSLAPAFVLLGSETTKWCCLPLLLSARSHRRCLRTRWLTEGVCVFVALSVHLLNEGSLCACALFWPRGQHLEKKGEKYLSRLHIPASCRDKKKGGPRPDFAPMYYILTLCRWYYNIFRHICAVFCHSCLYQA